MSQLKFECVNKTMEKEDEVVFSHFKLLVDILRKEIFSFKFNGSRQSSQALDGWRKIQKIWNLIL